MEQADSLLASGDLAAARGALVQSVRENPGDLRARMFLFQLLLLTGEWQKAETQLRSLAQTSPDAQMLNVVYAQAIAAEMSRADAFKGKAPFVCLSQQSPWLMQLADALGELARGNAADAAALRDQAFDTAPPTPGRWGELRSSISPTATPASVRRSRRSSAAAGA